ncbi:hypothetical protein AB1Y20_022794 [Prymnesium parvum]|uniref:Uncharacterized protein n=1 Tax=Prymnesium parvum TaxID=97485 RepID=A0AB34JEE5_PRYPA
MPPAAPFPLAPSRSSPPASFAPPLRGDSSRAAAAPRASRGPSAGHSLANSSFAARLARTGQLGAPRSLAPLALREQPWAGRPAWNDRIPVWEQCIPHLDRSSLPQTESSAPPHRRPLSTASSTRSRSAYGTVASDWSLLFSAGRQNLVVRRPWPEYQPESSAAVGRRWQGCALSRLHEHHFPPSSPSSTLTCSQLTGY